MNGVAMTELLLEERQDFILCRLRAEGRVVAGDLARLFRVSEDTVRRDLRAMAAAGLCRRVYGGALAAGGRDRPMSERLAIAADRKAALAEAAVALIEPDSTIFIDAGSTNLAIARRLPPAMRLTVATNAPVIAAELVERPNIELVVIGGRVDPMVGAAVDAKAMRDVEALRPDLLMLGACGLDERAGVTATRYDDAEFKRFVAERSRSIAVALTSDKIGVPTPYSVLPLSQCAALVVEHDADDRTVAGILAAGVRAIKAERPADAGREET